MVNTKHLFGNVLAAIDIETTGQDPCIHEICQLAIIPLNSHMEPQPDLAFISQMCPQRPELADERSMAIHKISMTDLLNNAPAPSTALRMLDEWWQGLPKQSDRRITPIAHNWAYERSYLVPWLGPELFDLMFHSHARDTMSMALFINDRAQIMGYDKPFKAIKLSALCEHFHVINKQSHNAFHDAMATAELYRQMLVSVT